MKKAQLTEEFKTLYWQISIVLLLSAIVFIAVRFSQAHRPAPQATSGMSNIAGDSLMTERLRAIDNAKKNGQTTYSFSPGKPPPPVAP